MVHQARIRRPSLATVLAGTALFVALGGPAAALDVIKGSEIKKGTVTGKQVKNRSLGVQELKKQAVADLRAIPDGAVTGASVRDGSLGGADLAPAAVGRDRIAADAVDTGLVADGSLAAVDVGRFAGSFTVTFPTINAQTCNAQTSTSLSSLVADQDLRDDAIVVTPEISFPTGSFTVTAQPASTNQIVVTACNNTAGNLVPGATTFRFVSFDL